MILETYIPGEGMTEAGKAIAKMMEGVNEGRSYADMMRLRISGGVSDQCEDTYFVAREGEECLSRLWHGWGKHENAIGNFGNFMTREDLQGQGIGKQMMALWQQTIDQVKGETIVVKNKDTGKEYVTKPNFSELEINMILKGGKINAIKEG